MKTGFLYRRMPLRMLDYSVRLKGKYGLDVMQIIIFLKKTEGDLISIVQQLLEANVINH